MDKDLIEAAKNKKITLDEAKAIQKKRTINSVAIAEEARIDGFALVRAFRSKRNAA